MKRAYGDLEDKEDTTAPHGCLSIVSLAVLFVLGCVLGACTTPTPKPDKVVRVDLYDHTNSSLAIIGTVLKSLPLPLP
jgi:hypothetical protein